MNEDFIPFELAKKLREKGFDESCFQKYDYEGYLSFNLIGYINGEKPCDDFYVLAPTISQVLNWLRKEKNIHITIPALSNKNYWWEVRDFNRGISEYVDNEYESFEEAALAGIEYVIDNLI